MQQRCRSCRSACSARSRPPGSSALAGHVLLDLSWTTAGLLGAAVAPTDPAVVFGVLGNREIRGRSGTVLEGESGANDPVGIALMVGMIEFATSDEGSFWGVLEEFAVEMTVGVAVGVAGWRLLLPLVRRVPLPEPTLHPLRVLAAAGVIYGVASSLHGSGFIAVFVAGILLGDEALPRKGEIESFLSGLVEPGRDHGLRRARAHDPARLPRRRARLARRDRDRARADVRRAAASSSGCSCCPCGSAGASGCS